MTTATHEQAMACLTCGLAGGVPDDYFPMPPGLWEDDCPVCGAHTVWIAEPREKTKR
jgi:hypothetical protein